MTTHHEVQPRSQSFHFASTFGSRKRSLFLIYFQVADMPSPKINREVRLKKMEVQLHQNFTARVPDKLIQHSWEQKLHKRVAEQQEKIALLMNVIDVLLDQ